ncbi:C-C motif chemokine 4-like [Pempheris klunzingeri]|uniref:C-C motif chemokine 4-like n=1 Tax=Pempheris klunzingeri TaxID=3127111 RepID=UPI003980ADA4
MTMMMKNSIILVTCLLLMSSVAVLASENGFGPVECCFSFHSTRLPKNKVVSYKYTDKRCLSQSAVIFKMKKGGVVCASPSVQWVKDIIKAKEWQETE